MKKLTSILLCIGLLSASLLSVQQAYSDTTPTKQAVVKNIILKKRELQLGGQYSLTTLQAIDSYFAVNMDNFQTLKSLHDRSRDAMIDLRDSGDLSQTRVLVEYIYNKALYGLGTFDHTLRDTTSVSNVSENTSEPSSDGSNTPLVSPIYETTGTWFTNIQLSR